MSEAGKFFIAVIVPLIIILTVFIPQQLKKEKQRNKIQNRGGVGNMNQNTNTYLALSILGLGLVVFAMPVTADYSEILAGFIMGVGLSMSAFSTFKLLKIRSLKE